MTEDERAAIKVQFNEHWFVRVVHPLGECLLAVPKRQTTEEKTAAAELYHGSTVKLK
jgi:hypothetical protein